MNRYEYQSIMLDTSEPDKYVFHYKNKVLNYNTHFETVLALLGEDGWELVTAMPLTDTNLENQALIPITADTITSYVYTAGMIYYFKRVITDDNNKINEYHPIVKEIRQIEKAWTKSF